LGEGEEEEEEEEEMGDEGVPVDDLEADLPGNHQAHHRPKFKLNLQLLDFTRIKRWRNNRPVKRWIFLKLLPVAIVFMLSVIGSSSVHFREASTIDGELYALTSELPVLWPLDDSHYLAELRIQIPSLAGEMGHHKLGSSSRRSRSKHTHLPTNMTTLSFIRPPIHPSIYASTQSTNQPTNHPFIHASIHPFHHFS
jgi:hypothetical protein